MVGRGRLGRTRPPPTTSSPTTIPTPHPHSPPPLSPIHSRSMDPLSDLLRVVRLDGAFFYSVEAVAPVECGDGGCPGADA